jgi:hypothetical protein
MHPIEADFEVLVDGKETTYQPNTQGFNDKERFKTTMDYLPHQWV